MKPYLFIIFLLINLFSYCQPDIILHNGKIFTSDKNQLWAEAIAIKGEKILTIGRNDEVMKLKGAQTRLINLDGRLVVPGFNDAHAHIGARYAARRFSIVKDISDPTPWEIISDSIVKIVKEVSPGTVIITEINPDLLEDTRARRTALDSISPVNPVILSAWTGHGRILNTAALEWLGFNEQSSFEGGRVDKDSNGQLTGLMEEYACYQVNQRLSEKLTLQKIIDDIRAYHQQTAALGITTMQNMCTQLPMKQLEKIYTQEEFACRVRLIAFPFTNQNELLVNDWRNMFHPLNKMNYVSGVKMILDGTPIERLACMREPYSDRPGQYGRLNFTPDELKQYMQFCLLHNQQIIIHAVGDSAIVTIIHTMRALHPDDFWKDKRLRIEHAELAIVQPADIETIKESGIVIVQNPTHLAVPAIMARRLDGSRTKYVQAMRSLLDNNIPFAIGSDGPSNPFLNLMLATFHPDNPKEAITLEEAVIAYTYGSAYAEFKEKEKGTLASGMLADLAVLSQNIFEISPDKLPGTESILTLLGGKIVYDKKMLTATFK
jgi:predicted amidohydrolase YtcJ